MEADNPCKVVDLKPFLDDHAAGKCNRLPPHHRKIVDGAADRDPPDIPAREKDRADNVGIRGKYQVFPIERDDGTIVHGFKADPPGIVVPELRECLEKFPHDLAAGTVHHVHFHLIIHLNFHVGDNNFPAFDQFRQCSALRADIHLISGIPAGAFCLRIGLVAFKDGMYGKAGPPP